MQESKENLTGPGSGLIPLIFVIALAIATGGGIFYLHKTYYIDPMDPLRPAAVQAATHD